MRHLPILATTTNNDALTFPDHPPTRVAMVDLASPSLEHRRLGLALSICEDLADVVAVAVGWVEPSASVDEAGELGFEVGELTLAVQHVLEFGFEEVGHVATRGRSAVIDGDDAADFGQCEPSRLCDADEPQMAQGVVVVDPVAVGRASRGWEQPAPFVEPDCLGWQTEFVCELTDEHGLSLPLDLDLQIKVYLAVMDVTLLYFEDCPNWETANCHLRTLQAEIAGLWVTRHVVETPEEATRVGFRGSPSIIVDGVDVFADPAAPVGLSCRVYQTPDGLAGSPTLEQLRTALGGSS